MNGPLKRTKSQQGSNYPKFEKENAEEPHEDKAKKEEVIKDFEVQASNVRANDSYSFEFKQQFIDLYLKHQLGAACSLKGVSKDLGSKWVRIFKAEGIEGLKDKRLKNSGKFNGNLDEYVMEEFAKKRSKSLAINGLLLKTITLNAPPHVKLL